MQYFLILICFLLSVSSFNCLNIKRQLRRYFFQAFDVTDHPKKSHSNFETYQEYSDYEDLTIKMPIDHTNTTIGEWDMRYLRSSKYWRPNGSIFILVGGNQKVDVDMFTHGLMSDIAEDYGGVMFATEHRYYGDKLPHEDLKYLSSDQALNDLHALIQNIKSVPEYKDSKVVLVGGSYGGTLAVWLRMLHPESADVVIASSAPLLVQLEFNQVLNDVAKMIANYMPPLCTKTIKAKIELYNTLIKMKLTHILNILNIHNNIVCEGVDMRIRENQVNFFLLLAEIVTDGILGGLVSMYDMCATITNPFHNTTVHPCIYPDFREIMDLIKSSEIKRSTKHMLYQSCTEFGSFITTSAASKGFDDLIPLDYYFTMCQYLFNETFDVEKLKTEIKRKNDLFGGLQPNVTNVVFVYGQLDPTKSFQVLRPFSDDVYVISIENVSHCRELYPELESDLESLLIARKEIKDVLKQGNLGVPDLSGES